MIPGIQTHIVKNLTDRLSKDLDTEISIGSVRALPFSGIRLQEFLIKDLNNDTLLYAPDVHSEIDYFSIFKKHLYIGKVTFDTPEINLKGDEEEMNFTFLINSLGEKAPDTMEWQYSVRGLGIKNGKLNLEHPLFENPSIKPQNLAFSEVNMDLTRTSDVEDSINFRLDRINLTEQSGLKIEAAEASGKIRKDKISVNGFFLKTPRSDIKIDQIELPVNPSESSADSRFIIDIRKIILSPSEVGLFFNNIPDLVHPISLSGSIRGSLKNLKGRNIRAGFGNNSVLRTSFDFTDLTDFNETFIFMDVKELSSTPEDILTIIEGRTDKKIVLPSGLDNLGTIRYSGNLTGFFKDIVAYGKFQTNIGSVSTDISMKLMEDKSFSYSGTVNSSQFEIGKVFNIDESMGGLTMGMEVNGTWKSKDSYFTYLKGNIDAFEWNKYTYHDAKINGLFTHQRFDGSFMLNDPYGNFRFDGEIDASGKTPAFQFKADLENVMPDRLNILPQLNDGVVTMTVNTNFKGNNIDNLAGEINITDGLIFSPETSLEIDTLSLMALQEGNSKELRLKSDFIEGKLAGKYNFSKFKTSFLDMTSHFLPSVAGREPEDTSPLNQFDFEVAFKGFDKVLKLLYPDLKMGHDGFVRGNVDSETHLFDITANFDNISYKGNQANEIEFHANARQNTDLKIVTRAKELNRENLLSLYNFSVHHKAGRDSLEMNVFWNNWDEITNSGALYTTTEFRREKNNQFYFNTNMEPSTIILKDSVWEVSEANARYTPESIKIQDLEVSHEHQKIALDGYLHRESEDGMRLEMEDLNLSRIFGHDRQSPHRFGGIVNGSMELKNYFRTPLWKANLSVNQFSFNNDTLGLFSVNSFWNKEREALAVNTSILDDNRQALQGSGYIYPEQNNIEMALNLSRFNSSFVSSFIGNILQDFEAETSGNLNLTGPLNQPYLTGKVDVKEGSFDVDLLQTSYHIEDSIWFYPNEIRFQNMTLKDRHGKTGNFKGSIYHEMFQDMVYNLDLDVNNMLALNTSAKDNPFYYGRVYANGNLRVTGSTQNIELAISGETLDNTRFFIPMVDNEEAVQSNFIRFVSSDQPKRPLTSDENESDNDNYKVDLSGLELSLEIDVTPQARIEIIFDSAMGDLLSATGEGNIQIGIDRQGNLSFFGDYIINQGEYLFSLQNLVNKKFAINQGGTVSWQGNPYDAEIDLTAAYHLKASLSDLVGPMAETSTGNENDLQRRIPINCNLSLNGPLESPGIKFGIEAPTLSESRESYVLDFISSEEEMNRQVLSLLVLNRFYTPDYLRMGSEQNMQTNNAALVTTTEMLSNQLSRWLSNISSDVDVGVSYRPEDDISNEEIEVALSTQVFNNRVTINGNVGYGRYQTNTSKMVGDFDMDVKLNTSGTIRAKAYTRSNDDIIYETSPTTQGIGLSFQEEFEEFSELLRKYREAVFGKKEEE